MVEKVLKVLILEDNKENAREIKQYLEKQHFVIDIVTTGKDAAVKLSSGEYDCFLFDEVIPGKISGSQLLVDAMCDGIVNVPCIVMTGIANLERLKAEKGYFFSDFVDKQQKGWLKTVPSKIIIAASKAMRSRYFTHQFEKLDCLNDKIQVEVGDQDSFCTTFGPTTVIDLVKQLEDPNTSVTDKARIDHALCRKLESYYQEKKSALR